MRAIVVLTFAVAVFMAMIGAEGGGAMASNSDFLRAPALERMAGTQVDIAPWGYLWRSDRAVQVAPEAYFIPRRLDRIDRVYRTAYYELTAAQLKSEAYNQPDLLQPLLPKPKGELLTGLLWTGGLVDYNVRLQWPKTGSAVPPPEAIEVRTYPTAWGWFGWTVDRVLEGPEISDKGRTWTYRSDPTVTMDFSYSNRVPAATEMVAVFCDQGGSAVKPTVPEISVVGPRTGVWKRIDIEIEWGFEAKTAQNDFNGRLESYVAWIDPIEPLTEDKGTSVTSGSRWRSRAVGSSRRGIIVPLLYAPDSRPGLDSRVTVWSGKTAFTFRIADAEEGPVYIPEHGAFVTKAGSGHTAREFVAELKKASRKGIRQMTREHPEASSWEQLMREVRLWTCPEGVDLPPFPKVDDPPMHVQLSDQRWTDAWRTACDQLKGKHMWGGLGWEVGRVAHDMDLVGLYSHADRVYDYFLAAPGAKSDGDYSDGRGALEYAKAMKHDMGYNHDGTHASTGRLLLAMSERYFLTGDSEWFERNRARMQQAADWIIRQRRSYLKDVPNRNKLLVAGLMPPSQVGDYAMPACDWRWYYVDNALSLKGLQRFADALADIDPKAGRKYLEEAEAFRADFRRTVELDAALSPVRQGWDGVYRSFVPRMAYTRGLTGVEIGAPGFPDSDFFSGSLALAKQHSVMRADNPLIVGTLDRMEEMGMRLETMGDRGEARRKRGLSADDTWFWTAFTILPKGSSNPDVFLLQDDVPNFLRSWMNTYASIVGANGKLWEPWHLGDYSECNNPDNGTAAWFVERFRNLLLMEDGKSLWIARATPRVWLEQGKSIVVRNAPTHFGTLDYEIVSDVDADNITATIRVPSRRPVKQVLVRFRHPDAASIRTVTVNGRPWRKFDPARELIMLDGPTGKVVVVAHYAR